MSFDVSDTKKRLKKKDFDHFQELIKNCPKDTLEAMELCEFKKGAHVISAGEPLKKVYILLEGMTSVVDENVPMMPFSFQRLDGVDILGDYEMFTGTYKTIVTIIAMSDLLCIELSVEAYKSWMQRDVNALFIRTTNLIKVLAPQTQFHRQFLFVDNETKFILFVMSRIESSNLVFPFKIKDSKQELTAFIGCSERTINRILVSLEDQGLINRVKGKIIICEDQYYFLKQYLKDSEDSLKLTIPQYA